MNPEMLKSLMPMLMGMGIPVMIANIEKMQKLVTGGGASAKKGQQPAGQPSPQGAVPGPTATPPAGAGMDPQKMNMILQILKARGMMA